MPELDNVSHELFAAYYVRTGNATEAYVKAGFSKNGAAQSAQRLLRNAKVRARVNELKNAISEETVELAITDKNQRLKGLQDLWDRQIGTIKRRSEDPTIEAPGAEFGLIYVSKRKQLVVPRRVGRPAKVKEGDPADPDPEAEEIPQQYEIIEYRHDHAASKELREIWRSAAEELGQLTHKHKIENTTPTLPGGEPLLPEAVNLAEIFSPDELERIHARMKELEEKARQRAEADEKE